MVDFLMSGWSFFFRWPTANASMFRPLGVFLGPLFQTFVFVCFSLFGFLILRAEQHQWLPVIGLLGLSMLTGFFHEDGLADTADSLGVSKFDSHSSLEKIHSTFKDPRLGTFGVSALVLFWAFRILVIGHGHLSVPLMALVCLLSRTASLSFGLIYSAWWKIARSSRSSHIMQAVNPRHAALVLVFGCVLGILFCLGLDRWELLGSSQVGLHFARSYFLSLTGAIFLSLALSSIVFFALVKRTEALNGDLLGALVCISEVFLTICILRIF